MQTTSGTKNWRTSRRIVRRADLEIYSKHPISIRFPIVSRRRGRSTSFSSRKSSFASAWVLPSEVIISLAGPRGCSRIESVPGSLDRRRDHSVPSIRGENDTGVRDHPAPRGKRRARPRHVCLVDVRYRVWFWKRYK